MLQVWNKQGHRVYERIVKGKRLFNLNSDVLQTWSIYKNFFIYKPSESDQNSNYYHLVDLNKHVPDTWCETYLIEDFLDGDKTCKIRYLNF